jgi:hypothetical protein
LPSSRRGGKRVDIPNRVTHRRNRQLPRSGDGLERGRPARLCALGNRISLEGTPRRVGEHLPNRFGVQFNRTGTRASRPPKCIRQPNKFGRNAKTCWRTFANTFWRSVQTCSVLLRTEAGGTPAFQSLAASRQTYVVQRGQAPVANGISNKIIEMLIVNGNFQVKNYIN